MVMLLLLLLFVHTEPALAIPMYASRVAPATTCYGNPLRWEAYPASLPPLSSTGVVPVSLPPVPWGARGLCVGLSVVSCI